MKEEKIRILGFVGPSGCGKDAITRWLADANPNKYHYCKLCTTRPQRNEEDNGYYFLEVSEYAAKVLDGTMLNTQEFRGWFYGLSKEELVKNKINLLPMSNEMVMQMKEENNSKYDLKIVYIHTFDKPRLSHILVRENNPDCKEVCRRFLTDYDDYINNQELISHCYKVITNEYNENFFLDGILAAAACFEGD